MKATIFTVVGFMISVSEAFTVAPQYNPMVGALHAINDSTMSRTKFFQGAMGIGGIIAFGGLSAFAEDTVTLPSGTTYTITKSGTGPKPSVGELAAIRFKATVSQTGNVIDDIFNTPEPYYTRVGSGGLIKGVEEVLPKMSVGDRFQITVPNKMAFGPKGRPASAGKPR
jgi:peptidylprolyl isomerase